MPVPLPTQFGKYQLLAHIGEGGMADVYLGRLTGPGGFEKRLVVKVIRPELAERREFCELFVTEAKITVALSHANIVPVYELGIVQGQYFLAMELVDGPTLHQLVFDPRPRRGGPLPPAVSAYIMEQVLRGLDYAHRQGVIHRDLSLANVLCSRDGEVKIVDFGIAAQVHAKGLLPQLAGGSEGYMAPEQRHSAAPDARADLFAAGVVLWELLSGARFDADPAGRGAAEVPPELQRIVATATRQDPEDRYPDAAAMLAELSRYLRHQDAPTQADLGRLIRQRAPDERRGVNPLPRILTRSPLTRPAPRTAPQTAPRTAPMSAMTGPRTRELPRGGDDTPAATPPIESSSADGPAAVGEATPPPPTTPPAPAAPAPARPIDTPAPAATVIFASRPAPTHATWRTYLGAALSLFALVPLLSRLLTQPPLPPRGQASIHAPPDLAPPPRQPAPAPADERGALHIDVPPGATLRIDGAPAAAGAPIALAPGPHRVEAQAPGRRPLAQVLEVRPRETLRTRLDLPWAVGQLRLTSVPPGAAVQLNGAAVGSTPLALDVPLDRPATLRLAAPGATPTVRTVLPREWSAAPGEVSAAADAKPMLRVRVALGAIAQGELTIGALPWAQVFVDGEYRGDTPLRRLPLPAGTHALRLHCPPPGCAQARDLRESVTIEPGREVRRVADFRADPPSIHD